MLIDSHCHLYVEAFDSDRVEVMKRAMDSGIGKFYLPAIDSGTTEAMLLMEAAYPGICYCMAGLHPCSVNEKAEEELALVFDMVSRRKFAAIGEIGLDFYWDKKFMDAQFDAFHRQILLAIDYKLPIVIHTREAMRETIDVVRQYKGRVRGIFHCFGGSRNDAEAIMELGFLLGIGGVVTYKNAGLAEVIKYIGLEHLVLETDAPYLTPVPFRGKRNESSYLKLVQEKIAAIKQVDPEEVASITTANALNLFGN